MTRHSLIWFFLIIAIFLFSPLMIGSVEYKACIDRENDIIQKWYGGDETNEISKGADSLYRIMMVTTKIDSTLRNHFTKPSIKGEELAPGFKMPAHLAAYSIHIDQYWEGLLDNIYLFCLRLAQAWLWVYYMLPFLLAAFFDGIMNRKAKIASFKYTSPTLYNVSWHFIIFLVAASLVSFSVTVTFSALAYPAVITVIGLMIRMLISNVQHSA